jgi:hypothetical protein
VISSRVPSPYRASGSDCGECSDERGKLGAIATTRTFLNNVFDKALDSAKAHLSIVRGGDR